MDKDEEKRRKFLNKYHQKIGQHEAKARQKAIEKNYYKMRALEAKKNK